jgi:hypothetical protein
VAFPKARTAQFLLREFPDRVWRRGVQAESENTEGQDCAVFPLKIPERVWGTLDCST